MKRERREDMRGRERARRLTSLGPSRSREREEEERAERKSVGERSVELMKGLSGSRTTRKKMNGVRARCVI